MVYNESTIGEIFSAKEKNSHGHYSVAAKTKRNIHRKEVNDDGKKEKSSKKGKAFQQKEESDKKKEAISF